MTPRDLAVFSSTALFRHRVRTAFSLLGVTIGVAAIVILTGLGEGARRYVIGEFMSIGSNLVIIVPGRNETTGTYPGVGGVPNDLTLEDTRVLAREVPSVLRVAPFAIGNETASHRERRRQVMVVGTSHDYLEIRALTMDRGRFLPAGDLERGAQVVVLGKVLADELFPGGGVLGGVVRIGDSRMRVIGVLEKTGMQVGLDMDQIAIVHVATAMQMFNRTSLFRIVMQIRSHEEMDRTCERTLALLAKRHGEEDVSCITQASVVSALSDILGALTAALAGIAAVSLAVAGIGIMNVMLVSVSERTEEIGLLKAVGAGAGQILQVFLAEAIMISGCGGLLGLALGWLSVRAVGWIYPSFPAAIPAWSVAAALATAIGVGVLFGVLPARRATRLDPVAALTGR